MLCGASLVPALASWQGSARAQNANEAGKEPVGAPSATKVKPQTPQAAFAQARNEANTLARSNAEAGVERYLVLLKEYPGLPPFLKEQAYSEAARLRARSKNLDGALALLDEADGRMNGATGAALRLLETRAELLTQAGRAAQAEAILEAPRQRLLELYPQGASALEKTPSPTEAASLLLAHIQTLEAQEKWEAAAEAAREALLRVPGLLEDQSVKVVPRGQGQGQGKDKGKGQDKARLEAGAGAAFYNHLSGALLKTNRAGEALSWAKLRFGVCAFEKGAIDRAVAGLRAVWIASGQLAQPGRFNTFVREGSGSNPLEAIPAPPLDKGEVEAYLVALVPASSSAAVLAGAPDAESAPTNRVFGSLRGRQEQRISLLLVLGRYGEAAQVAQAMLQARPNAAASVAQIARVLKARQGSLQAGNRFYEFLKTGQGANPLEEVLP